MCEFRNVRLLTLCFAAFRHARTETLTPQKAQKYTCDGQSPGHVGGYATFIFYNFENRPI